MLDNATRLYISPLTPNLLPAVLGSDLATVAENVSYHEIQTFPEKNYGYVELPTADADRIKKKLSGAILRGSKMKVEEARPKKRRRDAEPEENDRQSTTVKSDRKSKKERKGTPTAAIPGHKLSPERKVQRGWTEPKKEKSSKKAGKKSQKQSSKYTDEAELLFRTQVPANKADLTAKKAKKPKKARHGAEEQTIHEFQNTTTQPSFLKSDPSNSRSNLEYVDGKGWVDEAGEVVEGEPSSVRQRKEKLDAKQKRDELKAAQKPATKVVEHQAASTSSSSESSLSSSSDDESDDDSKDDAGEAAPPRQETPPSASATTEEIGDVHPLESLFKKPHKPASQDVAKPSLEISTGFSFFGETSDDIEDEPEVPLTPFSRDAGARGLRSAAPTPDTAHPSRFNSYDSARFLGEGTSDEDEDADEEESTADAVHEAREASPKQLRSNSKSSAGISDFEKMFWEKRGENNRAWKGRRRAVLKEKRHRENRARRPKNW